MPEWLSQCRGLRPATPLAAGRRLPRRAGPRRSGAAPGGVAIRPTAGLQPRHCLPCAATAVTSHPCHGRVWPTRTVLQQTACPATATQSHRKPCAHLTTPQEGKHSKQKNFLKCGERSEGGMESTHGPTLPHPCMRREHVSPHL